MKSKCQKVITALTALTMTFSMAMSVNADTLLEIADSNNLFPTGDASAILNYDPDNNTYELIDEDGNPVLDDIAEDNSGDETPTTIKTTDSSEVAITTAPVSDITPATTPTVIVTMPPNWYEARYRAEIDAEIAATTTVTTKTTTKATTKTTTTTKKVTTTTTTAKVTTTTKTSYKGIDVSRHNGVIDWTKVKNAGIEFVMIRAGYGMLSDQVDANFKTNIAGAQKAGIECGVYWYSYAVSTSEALLEAKVCYNTIKGYKLSYPVAFDIEDDSQMGLTTTQISNITKVFCEYLESQKYYVSVYSFASMLKDKMNSSVLTSYDIWVAHTGVTKPNYSGAYGMWQYSHTGSVNGISGAVDLNIGYKYYPSIMKNNKLNGYT